MKGVNNMQESRVLVLNVSCEPLQLMGVQRAVRLVLGGKVEVIETGHGHLHSERYTLAQPVVIRLQRYVHVPYHAPACTRKGVLLRDKYACQYCGAIPGAHLLTLDHIVPRALGGRSTWENLVTACRPCNSRKANKPLNVARMSLRSAPVQPSRAHMMQELLGRHPTWRKYISV